MTQPMFKVRAEGLSELREEFEGWIRDMPDLMLASSEEAALSLSNDLEGKGVETDLSSRGTAVAVEKRSQKDVVIDTRRDLLYVRSEGATTVKEVEALEDKAWTAGTIPWWPPLGMANILVRKVTQGEAEMVAEMRAKEEQPPVPENLPEGDPELVRDEQWEAIRREMGLLEEPPVWGPALRSSRFEAAAQDGIIEKMDTLRRPKVDERMPPEMEDEFTEFTIAATRHVHGG